LGTWILNALNLLLVTVGSLLTFLHLWKMPRSIGERPSPEERSAYSKNRTLLTIAVGLIAAWLLIQCLAVIFL
jgi:hypothetical protein